MDVLGRIWDLSDIDGDGFLDGDEFAVVRKVCVCDIQRYLKSCICTLVFPQVKF